MLNLLNRARDALAEACAALRLSEHVVEYESLAEYRSAAEFAARECESIIRDIDAMADDAENN